MNENIDGYQISYNDGTVDIDYDYEPRVSSLDIKELKKIVDKFFQKYLEENGHTGPHINEGPVEIGMFKIEDVKKDCEV